MRERKIWFYDLLSWMFCVSRMQTSNWLLLNFNKVPTIIKIKLIDYKKNWISKNYEFQF